MLKKLWLVSGLLSLFALVYYFSRPSNLQPQKETFTSVSLVIEHDSRGPASARRGPREASILFSIKEDASPAQLQALDQVIQTYDLNVLKRLVEGKVQFAKAGKHSNEVTEIAEALVNTGAVEFAEPDSLILPSLTSNDPYLSQQWHHGVIGTQTAWDTTMGARGIVVASCDTGVDPTHPDLKSALLAAYNSEDGAATNLTPVNSHGTLTAGAMAAIANNSVGVAGVAGAVKILPIKITNFENGAAYLSAIADCITYAANKGAKVVNLSYGGTETATIDTAAQYLRSKGGLLVVAAGNDGLDTSSNTDYTSMFVVSAVDETGALPYWSNRGLRTDIVAPGVNILTPNLGGSYAYATGTSLAAPLVSGAAALVYSANSALSVAQVEDVLSSTADKSIVGYSENTHGGGRVNVAAAVAKAKQLAISKRRK